MPRPRIRPGHDKGRNRHRQTDRGAAKRAKAGSLAKSVPMMSHVATRTPIHPPMIATSTHTGSPLRRMAAPRIRLMQAIFPATAFHRPPEQDGRDAASCPTPR
jgi:hypothetical protein